MTKETLNAQVETATAQSGEDIATGNLQKSGLRKLSQYYSDEPKCCQGIPLAVPIPTGDDLCPWLGERRGSIYRLLEQQVLFRYKTNGLKEGVSSLYGPSVCDAKYGCRCGHRRNLDWLRSQAKTEGAS